MSIRLLHALNAGLACLLFLAANAKAAPVADSRLLDAGYRQMYNLNFAGAHASFELYKRTHPDDPLGPVSNAAAYLFSEFDRLHILEVELFTDNQKFEKRDKQNPDPALYRSFDEELRAADRIADAQLGRAYDSNAEFAKVLADGLRGDYLALIEKRNFAGLRYMKAGRALAEKLVAADPAYYDAYLAIGVENYLLGINPAPVRWVLHMGGAETNKDEGIRNLRLTAEKGHFLAAYARLLLAVAALREQDRGTAKRLLGGLAQEFPNNALYKRELERISQ